MSTSKGTIALEIFCRALELGLAGSLRKALFPPLRETFLIEGVLEQLAERGI